MKKFIILFQMPPAEAEVIKQNFPVEDCDCPSCRARAKPDSPVIMYIPLPLTADDAMPIIEDLTTKSEFVAAVNLEEDSCIVYKAVSSIAADADLMILCLDAYQDAAQKFAHKKVSNFAYIVDAQHPGPVN